MRTIALLAIHLALPTLVAASTCPMPCFAAFNAPRPPVLLEAGLMIATPYLDLAPEPPGTTLSLYRVHLAEGPDPAEPRIFLVKDALAPSGIAIHWSGIADPQACCLGAACALQCETECRKLGGAPSASPVCSGACPGVGGACCAGPKGCLDRVSSTECTDLHQGVFAGNGTTCADIPEPCGVGACCDYMDFVGCYANDRYNCVLTEAGVYMGVDSSCSDTPWPCRRVFGACCLDAGGCMDDLSWGECPLWGGISTPGAACGDPISPCQRGACCVSPGNCFDDRLRLQCTGTFYPGQVCSSIGC